MWCKSHKFNMQNKFSFGPSQEDEGRKKTAHPTDGAPLSRSGVCAH
jgi:hypothetical protein